MLFDQILEFFFTKMILLYFWQDLIVWMVIQHDKAMIPLMKKYLIYINLYHYLGIRLLGCDFLLLDESKRYPSSLQKIDFKIKDHRIGVLKEGKTFLIEETPAES
jgi:hypothetical protein